MKYLIIVLIILLNGCLTTQQPNLPDKTAVYHTTNDVITEPDTQWEDFIDKCYYDNDIKSAEYYPGNGGIVEWRNE